jgi:hypothetical protein
VALLFSRNSLLRPAGLTNCSAWKHASPSMQSLSSVWRLGHAGPVCLLLPFLSCCCGTLFPIITLERSRFDFFHICLYNLSVIIDSILTVG